MYNPPRLVLAFVQSAAALGAICANHCEAVGLVVKAERVQAVQVRDQISGERFDIPTRLVLNAAGPYAERLLAGTLGRGLDPPTPFSRDAYFIIRRKLIDGDDALTVPARTNDPDAVLSRGGRHLFIVPWRGVTLVGVWHKVYHGDPDRYEITEAELERWIAEINEAYPGIDLSVDEVALGSAGLVPFGENDPSSQNLKFAHRSRLLDHAAERGLAGLLTLIGVRYTTGPADGIEAVDLACRQLGRTVPPSRLAWTPVRGGDVPDFDALVRRITAEMPAGASPAVARALAHNHGSAYGEVLALCGDHPELGRPLADSNVLKAEIVHAARAEMAVTLADAAFRRTDLCTAGLPSLPALREAARLMAESCGWDQARETAELDHVIERLALARTGRALLTDSHLPRVPVAAGAA